MRLYLITDDSGRGAAELGDVVGAAIEGGVSGVQFREKALGGATLVRAFETVAAACRRRGIPLFLNSDIAPRLECEITCEGIHYNSRTLPLHPGAVAPLAGYSAHDGSDAESAFRRGVSFCTVSPVFETPSKIGVLDSIGLTGLSRVREQLDHGEITGPRVLVALGGIDTTNAAACIRAGADGVAVIRAIMAAKDPQAAARRLRDIVDAELLIR